MCLLRYSGRRTPTPLGLHRLSLAASSLYLAHHLLSSLHPALLALSLLTLLNLSLLSRLTLSLLSLTLLPLSLLPNLLLSHLLSHPLPHHLRRSNCRLPFLLCSQHLCILHRRAALHPLHACPSSGMHGSLPLRIPHRIRSQLSHLLRGCRWEFCAV